MRISLVMTATTVGGVWRNVVHMAEGLRDRGHDVRIGLSPEAEGPRVEAYERDFTLSTVLESLDPRVEIWHIHLHDTYDPRAAALIAARRALGATVATEHLSHFNGSDRSLLSEGRRSATTAPVKTVLKRASIATCSAVIIPSVRVSEFFRRRYHLGATSKVHSIPNGVPAQREVQPMTEEPIGRVLASGSLGFQKGFDLLAEAAALSTVQWPLAILGEGAHRHGLEQELGDLMGTRAVLPGWQDDPLAWVEQARVVCLPSRWETLPFAAIEAQLAARPVVAFAVDGIPEIVEHEVTGILVEPGDIPGLAGALDRLSANVAEAARMGLAGRKRALARFGLDDMLSRTEAVYREVSGHRRQPSPPKDLPSCG
jgi:glycosyltransferase involved in cell wall biosynthesis